MAPSITGRLLGAAAVALQGLADGLVVNLAAVEQLQSRLDTVDTGNASNVAELALALAGGRVEAQSQSAQGEASPAMLDKIMMRWLDETFRASEELEEEEEVNEQEENDLVDAVPESKEDVAGRIMLSSVSHRTFYGRQAGDGAEEEGMSELGAKHPAQQETKPDKKERKRYRKAHHTSWRKMHLANKFAKWLSGAGAMENAEDVDSNFSLEEILNVTEEAKGLDLSPEQAQKELKQLQSIWDKYDLDNDNVTAIDIVEKLYPSNDTWFEDSNHHLHTMSENQSREVGTQLREEVESLKAELERVSSEVPKMRVEKLKAEVSRLRAEKELLDASARLDAVGGNSSVLRQELRQRANESAPLPLVLDKEEEEEEQDGQADKQTDQAPIVEVDEGASVLPFVPAQAGKQAGESPSAEPGVGASGLLVTPTPDLSKGYETWETELAHQLNIPEAKLAHQAPSAEVDEGASVLPFVPTEADMQANEAPSAELDDGATGLPVVPNPSEADNQTEQSPSVELDDGATGLPVVPNPSEADQQAEVAAKREEAAARAAEVQTSIEELRAQVQRLSTENGHLRQSDDPGPAAAAKADKQAGESPSAELGVGASGLLAVPTPDLSKADKQEFHDWSIPPYAAAFSPSAELGVGASGPPAVPTPDLSKADKQELHDWSIPPYAAAFSPSAELGVGASGPPAVPTPDLSKETQTMGGEAYPSEPGCYLRTPSGCPDHPNKAATTWSHDALAEERVDLDDADCLDRKGRWDDDCGTDDVKMVYVPKV